MKQRFHLHLLFLIAILTSSGMAQVSPAIPPELKTLRTRYRAEFHTVREPLRNRYISSLDALLRTSTKNGDLDASLGVQQELNNAKGKTEIIQGGIISPDLSALKARYEADVQTASQLLQAQYITALEALQESFTKRGNLTAALAVKEEIGAVNSGTEVRDGDAISLPLLVQRPWRFHVLDDNYREIYTFKPNKTAEAPGGEAIWRVTGNVLYLEWNNSVKDWHKFSTKITVTSDGIVLTEIDSRKGKRKATLTQPLK